MARAIMPFLMFEGVAEDAIKLYISPFENSQICQIERYKASEQGVEGLVKRADFIFAGQRFICIDSPISHNFSFTPAISIFVDCEDKAELQNAFNELSVGGTVLMLLDNYGFSS